MANCKLQKYDTYEVKDVSLDASTGKYVVKLLHPPVECPDGVFLTNKADVQTGLALPTSRLAFSTARNQPVIQLKSGTQVLRLNDPALAPPPKDGVGFGTVLLLVLVGGVVAYLARKLYLAVQEGPDEEDVEVEK